MQSLDNLSHYLIEFQYTKFDEVEVPGQYTEVNSANDFPICYLFYDL